MFYNDQWTSWKFKREGSEKKMIFQMLFNSFELFNAICGKIKIFNLDLNIFYFWKYVRKIILKCYLVK